MTRSKNPAFEYTAEEFAKIWVHQLYREYDNLLFQYRVQMKPAVIQIGEMETMWATWKSRTRTITISRHLIEKYSWSTVLEILKHEMAHQAVDELLGGEPGHGEKFKTACALFHVADWARRATGELPAQIPHWKDRVLSEEEERLQRRAEKLLALAGSENEHEAALAMQRVQELYRKYNLDRLRSGQKSAMVYTILHDRKQRTSPPQAKIFSILAEHFFVKVIYTKIFDAQELKRFSAVEVFGTRENVLMAEYVHGFLTMRIESLWKSYQAQHGVPGRRKNSYLLGVLSGFREKLRRQEQEVDRETKAAPDAKAQFALIAISDERIEASIRERYPRLQRRLGSQVRADGGLFSAGRAEGEKISLHKPVAKGDGNQGLTLKRGS